MTFIDHFWNFLLASFSAIVTIVIYLHTTRKKEHKETQDKLDQLITHATFLPPHLHIERSPGQTASGPLLAENIQYAPGTDRR